MRLLITGGAGFVGSNYTRHVLTKYPSYKVTVLDKLTYAGNLQNIRDLEGLPNFQFIQGDICNDILALDLAQKHDIIINFAAETHVDRSIRDPKGFITTDVIGTFTLLESVRRLGNRRLMQISTDEVYGSILQGAAKETSPFLPSSPYSASKASADLLCHAYFVTYALPVIVTHSCNIFGPYQHPEKVIPLFVTNLLEGRKIPLYGDGLNVREWLFVEDHSMALDKIMHEGLYGESYNIGSAFRINNLELTHHILELLDRPPSWIERVTDRPGHDRRYSIDSSKIRKELGWTPKHEFKEALKATVQWYKENPQWWKVLKRELPSYAWGTIVH